MTTFISGGTSSIGRVLVQEFARQGEKLRVLMRPNSQRDGLELPGVEFVPGDVTDIASLRAGIAGCDQVCHLAAVVGGHVPETVWWQINRDGTHNVLKTAAELGVSRMVQVSSISVLGSTQPGETADESHLPDPASYLNLYQKTKRAADDLAREYARQGLEVCIVYPGFGFGPSHAASHPSMHEMTLLRMANHKPTAVMGSGKNRLLLSYYPETVSGILLALQKGQRGEDYILGGENLTFPQIWDAIAEVLGKEPPRKHIPIWLLHAISTLSQNLTGKSVFPPDFFEMISCNWCYNSEKARRYLGWQAQPFRESIAKTWQYYQRPDNTDLPQSDSAA